MTPPPVVAVVGPTATGKTALAVELARRLGGEVVNADSMQFYRGMDIGTAKPTAEERGGVPHHLLDLWHVREAASVAEYARDRAGGRSTGCAPTASCPLLVGGSGLYVRAVLDDLDFPGTDPALRARLEAELAAEGPAALHARLAGVDPAAAAAVLPSNGRRIVRALEVVELTGGPFRATLPEPRPHYPAVVLGLDRDAAELDERVAHPRRPDVGGRVRRRGRGAGRRRAPRGPDRVAGAGLRAGARPARRRALRRRGPRGDGAHDAAVRAAAAVVVPARRRRPLVRRGAPDLLDEAVRAVGVRTIGA